MTNNRFKQHSGAFKCEMCGKLTRDTGHDEATFTLCKKCLFNEYMKNAKSDYGIDSEQYKKAKKNYEAA